MFPHKTVAENVSFGLQRAVGLNEALDLVRLAHLERRLSSRTFSGGEQQRVALACALAPNPAVLLLDEPFSNMDVNLRTRIREEVKLSLLTQAVTVVFVTYDQEEALFIGVGSDHQRRKNRAIRYAGTGVPRT